MVQLELDNVYLKINNMDKDHELKLWDILSFQVQVFGMQDIRYRHLFNRKTKKTYSGLFPYVIEFCNENSIQYQLFDNRVKPEQDGNFKLVEYIDSEKKIKLEPRPYQQTIIDNCLDRAIIQAATGAGKTFIMAGLIAKFNVKPVCIFADKITLCIQLKNEMERFLGTEVGLVGGGFKDYKDITVISLQSAEKDYISKAKLCMWDECLVYDSDVLMADGTYKKIGDIVENEIKEKVITYNTKMHCEEEKEIIGFAKKEIGDKRLMKIHITLNDGQTRIITCTNNHKIWVCDYQKYIEADKLTLGLKVMVNHRKYSFIPQLEAGIINKKSFYDDGTKFVYDIEVADNHNFFTSDILVSNCHHIPALTTMNVANQCTNAYYRIGVSATPWRDAGDDMLIEAVLNKKNEKININASKLIELGYLVKPDIYFVPIKATFKGKNYNDLYNKAVVENTDRNKIICKIAYQMQKRNKKILILIKTIKHGEKLQDMLLHKIGEKVQPIVIKNPKTDEDTTVRVKNIEFLSGSDNGLKRTAVLEAVKQGKCDILIASTIADEGLDLPILDTLILAGGGKSSTRAFQRVGRVLRLYPGKKKAIVFDFTDYTPMLRRHSRVRQKLYKSEPLWDISTFNVNPD